MIQLSLGMEAAISPITPPFLPSCLIGTFFFVIVVFAFGDEDTASGADTGVALVLLLFPFNKYCLKTA